MTSASRLPSDTRLLCGLIGAGIQRSLSPALQEEEARQQGLRMHYQLIDLDRSPRGAGSLPALIDAVRVMGFAGINVTYPCKQSVMALLDELSDEAQAIGAVNTVIDDRGRLVGHNTDGAGWRRGFEQQLPHADLSRVVLLGAGGAGSACADAVLRLGASELVIVDRDAARASALAARLNARFAQRARAQADVAAAVAGATGLIHATPTGMAPDTGMPLPHGLLRASMWVSEIVYVPLETPLLHAARQAGCAVVDGGHMTVGQAVLGFRLFTGRDADADRMAAHFRRLVAAR